MNLSDLAAWIGSWFRHDEARFDGLHDDLVLLTHEIISYRKDVKNMTDAVNKLLAEVAEDKKAIAEAVAGLDSSAAKLAEVAASGDTAAIEQATADLAASRAVLQAAVAKDSPPATITDPPGAPDAK